MKKSTQFFTFLILTVFIVSCDNESNDNQTNPEIPNNSEVLTSITINSTWVNYIETINLDNGKISNIQYSDGTYHIYTYLGDNVAQINEYDFNDNILFTKSFTYNGNGQLIEQRVTPNELFTEWDGYQIFNYTYEVDSIITTYKLYDFDDVQQGDTQFHNLILNQSEVITSYSPILSLSNRSDVTYLSDNPITYTNYFSNQPTVNSTYEYINEVAADAYSIDKFKYGQHWKINSLLSYGIPTLGTYVLDDITTKYLSKIDYNYNYQEQSINNVTLYSYEFDEDNLLLSQTQTKNNSNDIQTYITEITYMYQ